MIDGFLTFPWHTTQSGFYCACTTCNMGYACNGSSAFIFRHEHCFGASFMKLDNIISTIAVVSVAYMGCGDASENSSGSLSGGKGGVAPTGGAPSGGGTSAGGKGGAPRGGSGGSPSSGGSGGGGGVGGLAATCEAEGGQVWESWCCKDNGGADFPDLCSFGNCTCAPDPSVSDFVKMCSCPQGCWDGARCVPF